MRHRDRALEREAHHGIAGLDLPGGRRLKGLFVNNERRRRHRDA